MKICDDFLSFLDTMVDQQFNFEMESENSTESDSLDYFEEMFQPLVRLINLVDNNDALRLAMMTQIQKIKHGINEHRRWTFRILNEQRELGY